MRAVLVVKTHSYHQHCCHHQHWACTHHAAGSFSVQFCAFPMRSAETAFTDRKELTATYMHVFVVSVGYPA